MISMCLSFLICKMEPVTLTLLGSGEESVGPGMKITLRSAWHIVDRSRNPVSCY